MSARIVHRAGDRGPNGSRLIFVQEIAATERGERRARFRCDCGEEVICRVAKWRSGYTRSCGCLHRDVAAERHRTHGQSESGLYRCWAGMIQRTTPGSSTQRDHPRYVGVGRDPAWDTFEGFAAEMAEGYFEGACLARTGDVGDYTAQNCRWATRSENSTEMTAWRDRKADGTFV